MGGLADHWKGLMVIEFMEKFANRFSRKRQKHHREQIRLAEMASADLTPSASTS